MLLTASPDGATPSASAAGVTRARGVLDGGVVVRFESGEEAFCGEEALGVVVGGGRVGVWALDVSQRSNS